MTNAIHFQRVTIHLKNGTNLGIDLQAEDPHKPDQIGRASCRERV